MNRFIAAISLICIFSTPAAQATPCFFNLDSQTLSRITEDPVLEPLAREWLRLSEKESASDEVYLKTTYRYLVFIADFLKLRERPDQEPASNPYVNFLKNMFEAKEKGVEVERAIDVTSKFLDRFMTDQGIDLHRIGDMVYAIQKDLVPEMALLQFNLSTLSAPKKDESQNDESKSDETQNGEPSKATRLLASFKSPFEEN